MKLKSLAVVFCLSAGVVALSYSLNDKGDQSKREQDSFSKGILKTIAGDDNILDTSEKRDFTRYLGFPDAVQGGDDLLIVPKGKNYDILVGPDARKLTSVDRQTLEGYFPGRDKPQ